MCELHPDDKELLDNWVNMVEWEKVNLLRDLTVMYVAPWFWLFNKIWNRR